MLSHPTSVNYREGEREHFSITSVSASETGACSFFILEEGGLTQGAGGVKVQPAHTYRKSS